MEDKLTASDQTVHRIILFTDTVMQTHRIRGCWITGKGLVNYRAEQFINTSHKSTESFDLFRKHNPLVRKITRHHGATIFHLAT
jgi:hypothetical protein